MGNMRIWNKFIDPALRKRIFTRLYPLSIWPSILSRLILPDLCMVNNETISIQYPNLKDTSCANALIPL